MVSHASALSVNCLKKYCKKLQILTILLSGFCIYLLYGTIYTIGNIQPYLVSYVRKESHPSYLRYTDSTLLFSTQYTVIAIGGVIGSASEKQLGVRLSLLIGGIISSFGLFLSFFAIQFSFWLVVVSFGVLYPFGTGMMYIPTMICVIKWVPSKQTGIAVGVVMSAIGISGTIFGLFQTGFINTFDKFPDDSPYKDVDEKYFTQNDIIFKTPYFFSLQSIIFSTVILCCLIFITEPNTPVKTDKLTAEEHSVIRSFLQELKVLFTTVDFYLLYIACVLSSFVFGFILPLVKVYGMEVLLMSDYSLTVLEMIIGIFNSLGRLLMGGISDVIGYKLAFVFLCGVNAVILLTLSVTTLGLPIMYFIWVCSLALCYGGFSTVSSMAVLNRFGIDNLNLYLPLTTTTGQIVGSILIGILSRYFIDYFGWSNTFLILGCCGIVQLVCVLLLQEETKNKG